MYTPGSTNERIFGGLMATQAIIILALELFILVEWQLWMHPKDVEVAPLYIVPVNAAIVWFACIYEFSLSLNAMHHKNNIQLFAICICNAFVVAFAAMQYPAMKSFCITMPIQRGPYGQPLVDTSRNIWPQIRGPQLAVPIVIGLCTLGIWWFAFRLHKQYAWAIYRCVQGDSHTRDRHLAYEVYVVFVKLSAFFIICFVLQYGLIHAHFVLGPEFGLTMSIPPALTFVMILGVCIVRKEHKPLMILVIVCHLAMIAYLLSRIAALYGNSHLARGATKYMMTAFAFSSLILTILSLACGIRCLNFGYGLKHILAGKAHPVRASYDFHTFSRYPIALDDVSHCRLSLA
ncbi:UPF0658 Golgi apparatus membrane protein C23H3.04 [Aspergillus udagawae]|nr:UPF0658 Golgi apparatus membrane protein C23H3.04 [Aspergillus udagawae]